MEEHVSKEAKYTAGDFTHGTKACSDKPLPWELEEAEGTIRGKTNPPQLADPAAGTTQYHSGYPAQLQVEHSDITQQSSYPAGAAETCSGGAASQQPSFPTPPPGSLHPPSSSPSSSSQGRPDGPSSSDPPGVLAEQEQQGHEQQQQQEEKQQQQEQQQQQAKQQQQEKQEQLQQQAKHQQEQQQKQQQEQQQNRQQQQQLQSDEVKEMKEEKEDREYSVLIIGKTGNGKSSLANTLTGGRSFKQGRGLFVTTQETQAVSATVRDRRLKVIDTADFTNIRTDTDASTATTHVQQWKQHTSDGNPDVIILVVRCDVRYTKEEHDIYREIVKEWGDDYLFRQRLMVAFTFGDLQDEDLGEELKTVCDELKNVLADANHRYVQVNNRERDEEKKAKQLSAIFGMIDEVIQSQEWTVVSAVGSSGQSIPDTTERDPQFNGGVLEPLDASATETEALTGHTDSQGQNDEAAASKETWWHFFCRFNPFPNWLSSSHRESIV